MGSESDSDRDGIRSDGCSVGTGDRRTKTQRTKTKETMTRRRRSRAGGAARRQTWRRQRSK